MKIRHDSHFFTSSASRVFLLFFFSVSGTFLYGHNVNPETYPFKENKGQQPDQVLMYMDAITKQLYIEKDRLRWHVINDADYKALTECNHGHVCDHDHSQEKKLRGHVYDLVFKNGRTDRISQYGEKSFHYSNYFIGNDKSRWAHSVHDYSGFTLDDVWDGIDFRMYEQEGSIKYDWIVEPGANPKKIVLKAEHLDDIYLKDGKCYQVNSIDTIIENAPLVYQIIGKRKKYIDAKFELRRNELSYSLGDYDKTRPLIIDPVLVFSTYTGSRHDNWGSTATPGPDGEFYAGGVVFGTNYPITNGAYQINSNVPFTPPTDPNRVFLTTTSITKFSPDGEDNLYSTFLGGSSSEFTHSLIVNNRGELVVLGSTSSTNFATSNNSYQSRFGGGTGLTLDQTNTIDYQNGSDIYVAVLSEDGRNLVGSTFLGGSGNDGINLVPSLAYNYGDQFRGEVIIDDQDNIYIASSTRSGNMPVTDNSVLSGIQDGYVASLNRTCSNLRFAKYLGGSSGDAAYSLRVNFSNEIYITGGTTSTNFPTFNALNPNFRGGSSDGFLVQMTNTGNILSSTYIGTSSYDQGYLVALDNDNDVYVLGQSNGNMPVSNNVYSNPNSGQFIHIYSSDLQSLEISTVIGTGSGDIDISPTALMIDTCFRVFISGWGGSVNVESGGVLSSTTNGLPITPDAYQRSTDGSDFYFAVYDQDMDDLVYATYFGRFNQPFAAAPDHVDGGTSRFSEDGVIYQAVCAGCGGFSDFPTTENAYSRINGTENSINRCNLAAVKFDFQLSAIRARIDLVLDTIGCAPYFAEFINNSSGATEFLWDFGDGSSSVERAPTHGYLDTGSYEVCLFASAGDGFCPAPDTICQIIRIINPIPPNDNAFIECERNYIDLRSSYLTGDFEYLWEDGVTAGSKRVFQSGRYSVTATQSNCEFIDNFDVEIINSNSNIFDTLICGQEVLNLNLDPRADSIVWSTGDNGLSIEVDETGIYSVEYHILGCDYMDTARIAFATQPEIEIQGDTILCEGNSVTLSIFDKSGANADRITWSTGETGTQISVSEPGVYSVSLVTDSLCTDTESIEVIEVGRFGDGLASGDTLICADSEISIDLSRFSNSSDILWNDGSTEFIRSFDRPGVYTYTLSNICETRSYTFTLAKSIFTFEDEPIYIPNAFTPNEDLNNDIFKPETANELMPLDYRFMVFDRWGNKVFESQDIDQGWDGTFKGENMDPAIFAYTMEITYFVCEQSKETVITGDVNLQK